MLDTLRCPSHSFALFVLLWLVNKQPNDCYPFDHDAKSYMEKKRKKEEGDGKAIENCCCCVVWHHVTPSSSSNENHFIIYLRRTYTYYSSTSPQSMNDERGVLCVAIHTRNAWAKRTHTEHTPNVPFVTLYLKICFLLLFWLFRHCVHPIRNNNTRTQLTATSVSFLFLVCGKWIILYRTATTKVARKLTQMIPFAMRERVDASMFEWMSPWQI